MRQRLGLAARQGTGKSVVQSIEQGISGSIWPSQFPWQSDVIHAPYQQTGRTRSRSEQESVKSLMTHFANRQNPPHLEGESCWQEANETKVFHLLAPNAVSMKGENERGRFIR